MGVRMLELEPLPPGGAGRGRDEVTFFFFSTWHRPVFNFEQGASVFQGVEQWLEMPGRPVGLTGACSNQCSRWWGVLFAINALCRRMLIKCWIWALILPSQTKRECFTRWCQSRDVDMKPTRTRLKVYFFKYTITNIELHGNTQALTIRDS